MKPTPFRVILFLNALIVFGGLFFSYGSGAMHNDSGRINTDLMPFVVALADLLLGLACVVLMLVLRFVNREASAVAGKYMQAFMAAFGLVLIIAVPACFTSLGMR